MRGDLDSAKVFTFLPSFFHHYSVHERIFVPFKTNAFTILNHLSSVLLEAYCGVFEPHNIDDMSGP
jgi:hypothetical protein